MSNKLDISYKKTHLKRWQKIVLIIFMTMCIYRHKNFFKTVHECIYIYIYIHIYIFRYVYIFKYAKVYTL